MTIALHCKGCDRRTDHDVRPWQTSPGVFDAVTTLCRRCRHLLVLRMASGVELVFPEESEASRR